MAEHNVLRHICYETVDTGAFYIGRSWAQRGNTVRFNTFDTVRATERLAQKSCSQNAFCTQNTYLLFCVVVPPTYCSAVHILNADLDDRAKLAHA